jgi:hypothetical protein
MRAYWASRQLAVASFQREKHLVKSMPIAKNTITEMLTDSKISTSVNPAR